MQTRSLFALTAGVFLNLSFQASASPNLRQRDLSSLCPASDTGKFKCIDSNNFVICNAGYSIAQAMAPGVFCNDGSGNVPPAQTNTPPPPPPPSSLQVTPVTNTPPPPPPPPPPSTVTPPVPPTFAFHHYNCIKELQPKVLGQSVVGMFYCINDYLYVTCTDGDAPIQGTTHTQRCKQQKDQSYALINI